MSFFRISNTISYAGIMPSRFQANPPEKATIKNKDCPSGDSRVPATGHRPAPSISPAGDQSVRWRAARFPVKTGNLSLDVAGE